MPQEKQEKSELEIALAARYPLLYLVGVEESLLEEEVIGAAQSRKSATYFWDMARGWSDKEGADKGNPMAALDRVRKAPGSQAAIFVFKDLASLITPSSSGISSGQVPLVRELKNLAVECARDRRCVVLLSHELRLPEQLKQEISVIEYNLPTPAEISGILDELVGKKLKLIGAERERLVKACQGLTRVKLSRVLAKSLVKWGVVGEDAIELVVETKRQTVRETGILEFVPTTTGLDSVGGLENLKQWVRMRSRAFTDEARHYGIPNPKGVLLAGIQGTGKSLCAKTISQEWHLPLVRLDAGRLFGGIVGESESRVRQMIQLVEAIAPCVLFVDEIDKAFGGVTGGHDGDSGTSRRVFGTLITWMQEKTSPVFIVATANNVAILPAELLRKGRFDEIFWIDLPTEAERAEIFKVHLGRLRPSRDFDYQSLASRAENFSGAEIEQVIYDALQTGFSRDEEFGEGDLLDAIASTSPLAQIAAHQIESLQEWAMKSGAKPAQLKEQKSHSFISTSALNIDE